MHLAISQSQVFLEYHEGTLYGLYNFEEAPQFNYMALLKDCGLKWHR